MSYPVTRRSRRHSRKEGVFDPNDTSKVTAKRYGVWMLYEQIPDYDFRWRLPGTDTFVRAAEAFHNIEYFSRLVGMLVAAAPLHCLLFVLVNLLSSILPAISVWASGQMLSIVHQTVETRSVDEHWLAYIALGSWLASIGQQVSSAIAMRVAMPLQKHLRMQFTRHIVKAHLRIDVPTYNDAAVTRQLESAFGRGNADQAWGIISMIVRVGMSIINFASSLGVVIALLWRHPENIPLAIVSLIAPLFEIWKRRRSLDKRMASVWAATCTDPNYVRFVGLRNMATDARFKQEIVAGNLARHIYNDFDDAINQIGENNINQFHEARHEALYKERYIRLAPLLYSLVKQLPQIVSALQVVRTPASMPFTIASYNVIQTAVISFTSQTRDLLSSGENISSSLQSLKELYELSNLRNQVVDGDQPYPENAQETARLGISVEFRNVSFKYPGSDSYALKDVSFTITRGSLCVIVGFNGSGKSTILKLLTRLYDATDGHILLDGRDIRTLKVSDLRETIVTLFQDFEIYPLSIKANISMGDPIHANDEELIDMAAQQGGVMDFVDRLPHGLDSYLKNPVPDLYSSLPEGTKQLFGKKVDFANIRTRMGAFQSQDLALSGGQSQKIAVARTLMRAHGGKDRIGLLLFDEPSASLDPEAEYKLFDTLRKLRGSKSMIFSSHRFGNLTKHADLILYMKDSAVVEFGTHEQLLAVNEGYARMWKMQAEAFTT